jgi:hypothetical protein
MTLSRRDVLKGSAISLGASASGLFGVSSAVLGQGPAPNTIYVPQSGDMTGATDRAAIQAAVDALQNAGAGYVQLGRGYYYLNGRIIVNNLVTIRGTNGRGTSICAGLNNPQNDAYLFEFRNPGVTRDQAQFSCRLEDVWIRACPPQGTLVPGATPEQKAADKEARRIIAARLTAVVWGSSWNEQCGLRNVLITDYQKHAVLFTHGHGGSATIELRECEFMSAAESVGNLYPGLFFSTTHTVGYTNVILHHVITSGPREHQDYTCVEAANGINLIVTGFHVENCDHGISVRGRSNLTINGYTGGPPSPPDNTGVVHLITCGGDFAGTVFGSGVLLAGASGHVLHDNKNGDHICAEQNPVVFPTGVRLGC